MPIKPNESSEDSQERYQYYLKVAETICSSAFRNHPEIIQQRQEENRILSYAESTGELLDNLFTPEIEKDWSNRRETVLERDFGLSFTFPNKLNLSN